MYCPQCKSEYREGITACAECQTPLVESLAEDDEELEEEDSAIKILLETSHPTDLDPLILQLEERGIPYVLQSGTALSILEGRLTATLPEDWRAFVLVPSEHLSAANALIAELKSKTAPDEIEKE
jgi:uncharacterized Zn ribbon protein